MKITKIIRFSRHAKRRANLYRISEQLLLDALKGKELTRDKHVIVENIAGFRYPLKIVINVEDDIITVISNYPVRRRKA